MRSSNVTGVETVEVPEAPGGWRGAELACVEAGPWLAIALASGCAERSTDDALLEAVVGFRRLIGWATAGAARAAAVLADRPLMNPEWPATAGHVSVTDVTGEELAMALGCSRRTARTLVRDGRAYEGALAMTGDALARGEIDPSKARIVVDALDDQPVRLALDVQDAVLPGAPHRTPTQLARDVAKAVIAADPGGARSREKAAHTCRRVDRPRFLPDGMAGLWAVLPAAEATRMDAGLDRLARSHRASGDPRTLDQLRADLLVDLTLGDATHADTSRASAAPTRDPDADKAYAARTAAPSHAASPAPLPQEPASRPRTSPRSLIQVLVPLDALRGDSDAPAELVGYGPITAETARELAGEPESTWRRIVTDPLSGAVLDVGRTRYRPPADLVAHVQARDRWCVRPGCSAAAPGCDLDHTVEFGRDDGRTAHDNLGPLCRRDHQVKTDGGFTTRQVSPGVFEVRTPVGRRYRHRPGADTAYDELGRHQADPPF
ncbi:DUF222 domain-containing protein [Isoptericola sp. b490]|uniref:HNH endonuclease signature motif containing protein n=1 Tax=Actinotalea lenta TaxID=3064654 RepID=UPI0027123E7E|nr:HNH endonuclease signature motif containing protein [Isoptericola sp. b490]MDO8122322.1 DUF222 domain-containing protein [Isoptericola sp. b490]